MEKDEGELLSAPSQQNLRVLNTSASGLRAGTAGGRVDEQMLVS